MGKPQAPIPRRTQSWNTPTPVIAAAWAGVHRSATRSTRSRKRCCDGDRRRQRRSRASARSAPRKSASRAWASRSVSRSSGPKSSSSRHTRAKNAWSKAGPPAPGRAVTATYPCRGWNESHQAKRFAPTALSNGRYSSAVGDPQSPRPRTRHRYCQETRSPTRLASSPAGATENGLAGRGADSGPCCSSARQGRLHSGVRAGIGGLKRRRRPLGHAARATRLRAHRFRHTFATWAIAHDGREVDVLRFGGHGLPDMVRRDSTTCRSAPVAGRHFTFSPADRVLSGPLSADSVRAGKPPLSLRFP